MNIILVVSGRRLSQQQHLSTVAGNKNRILNAPPQPSGNLS